MSKLIAAHRKLIASLVGALASAVTLGLVADPWSKWTTVAITFLTAAGVYQTKNEPVDGQAGWTTVDVCLAVIALVAVAWALGYLPK